MLREVSIACLRPTQPANSRFRLSLAETHQKNVGVSEENDVVVRVEAFSLDLHTLCPKNISALNLPTAVGRVHAVGDAVDFPRTGDYVAFPIGYPWTEFARTSAGLVICLNETAHELPPNRVACLLGAPRVALMCLIQQPQLLQDDWVVSNLARTPVGRSLTTLARILRLRTINIVGTLEERIAALEDGGDIVVEATSRSAQQQIRRLVASNIPPLAILGRRSPGFEMIQQILPSICRVVEPYDECLINSASSDDTLKNRSNLLAGPLMKTPIELLATTFPNVFADQSVLSVDNLPSIVEQANFPHQAIVQF